MSVLCAGAQGRVLYCKGAPETVLAACDFVQFDAGIVPIDPAVTTRLLAAQQQMAEAGLRVLAFAHCAVVDGMPSEERGMTLTGLVGLEDPPRPEVPDAIARCATAGIRIIMVTGDHPHTALAIARQIGLVQDRPAGGHQRRRTALHLAGAAATGARRPGDHLRPCRRRAEDADRPGLAEEGRDRCRHRRRRQRRAGAEDRRYRHRHGHRRHRCGQGGGRPDPARRQLRQHRRGHRGRARGVREHPQVPHLHPELQHSRAGALSRLRAVPHSAAADHHPDSRRRPRHRHAAGAGPGRRKTRSRRDAPPAQGAQRTAAVMGSARSRLSVSRRAGSGGGDGGVLLRAPRRRLAVTAPASTETIRCICRRPPPAWRRSW